MANIRNTFSAAGANNTDALRRATNSGFSSLVRQINAADFGSGGGGVDFTTGIGLTLAGTTLFVDTDTIASVGYVDNRARVHFVMNATEFALVPSTDSTRMYTLGAFTADSIDFDSDTFYVYNSNSTAWVNVGSQSAVADLIATLPDTEGYAINIQDRAISVDTDELKIDPHNLKDYGEIVPTVNDTIAMYGIRSRDGDTEFRETDILFNVNSGERQYFIGRKPNGDYREAAFVFPIDVSSDKLQKAKIISEDHHETILTAVSESVGIDINTPSTYSSNTQFDYDTSKLSNSWIDTETIATRSYVTKASGLEFFVVNNLEGASGAGATGVEAIAIGSGSRARGERSFAMGDDAQTLAEHTNSIAWGNNAVTSAANQLRIRHIDHVRVDTDYNPTNDYDLASKKYVDDNAGGGSFDTDMINIYADSDYLRISSSAPTAKPAVQHVTTVTFDASNSTGYTITLYNLDGSTAHTINVIGGRSPQQQAFDLSTGVNGSSAPITADRTDRTVVLTWDNAGAIQGSVPAGISFSNNSFSTVVITTSGGSSGFNPPASFYTEVRLGTGITADSDNLSVEVDTDVMATRSWVSANTDNNVFVKAEFTDTTEPAEVNAADAIAIGAASHADTQYSIAIGFRAGGADAGDTTGNRSVCVGYESEANGTNSVAVGPGPAADGDNSIAIGRFCTAGHTNGVAIGQSASTVAAGQITFDGTGAAAVSFPTRTSDPSGMPDGSVYYNTSTDKLRLRANGSWVNLN